jgi:N-methylhydantoinase B
MMGGIHKGHAWAFYETMGVGLGARPKLDGTDGIQCNMTNTMNTPAEDIERSMPVLLKRYEFRPDSSGAGRFRGGCGLVRMFEMTGESTTVTIVSDRSRHHPWGLKGGKEGSCVEVILHEKIGSKTKKKKVPAKTTLLLKRRDAIELRTAGGGGFGNPSSRDKLRIEEDLRNELLSEGYVRKNYPAYRHRRTPS